MRLFLAHYRLRNGARGVLHILADHSCTAAERAIELFGLRLQCLSVRPA